MTRAADVIAVAKAEVGVREGRSPSGHANNIQKYSPAVPGLEWSQGQAWCATFVSWCAMRADVRNLFPRTASCLTGVAWFKQRKRWSEYPAIGAQVFFGANGGSHTGLVYAYDRDYIYTVEGNTNATGSPEGDGVYYKKRARRDAYVYGYGYPAYSEGIVSADPAWTRPTQPSVSLAHVVEAARRDIPAATGHVTWKADVLLLEQALVGEGLLASQWADGSFGTKTQGAYITWQRSLGYRGADADGIPGRDSLTRLGARHNFTVST